MLITPSSISSILNIPEKYIKISYFYTKENEYKKYVTVVTISITKSWNWYYSIPIKYIKEDTEDLLRDHFNQEFVIIIEYNKSFFDYLIPLLLFLSIAFSFYAFLTLL